MKAVLVYWIFGCIFTGIVLGRAITDCPKDELATADLVGAVAVWPAFFAAAVARTGEPPLKTSCKALQ